MEASVCWRCNNLFGTCEGVELAYAFDSKSEAATALLALTREVLDGAAAPGG
ncbi:MAG: hypothetical protein AAGK21_11005 [Bacteroidota bacterium]